MKQLALLTDPNPPRINPLEQVTLWPGVDARCEAGLTADTCRWPFCTCRFPDRR